MKKYTEKTKSIVNRAVLTAGSLPAVIGNALAAEDNAKTVGGMFAEIIKPLDAMAKDTLLWIYNWEAGLIPAIAILALGAVYVTHIWGGGGGGRDRTHSEKAVGEIKMEAIIRGLAVFVVCCIIVYLVYKKLLIAPAA